MLRAHAIEHGRDRRVVARRHQAVIRVRDHHRVARPRDCQRVDLFEKLDERCVVAVMMDVEEAKNYKSNEGMCFGKVNN